MKNFRLHIVLLIVLLAIAVLAEYYGPKEVNWERTYEKAHKIPFGTYVLYESLPDIFPNQDMVTNKESLYEYFGDNPDKPGNFIAITKTFDPGEESTKALYNYVNSGNNALISAENIGSVMKDTLGIATSKLYLPFQAKKNDTSQAYFVNPRLPGYKYNFYKGHTNAYIEQFDTSKTTIISKDGKENVIMVKIIAGRGHFYIHSRPLYFTNYNILKGSNSRYIATALSHLPEEEVIWDEKYKPLPEKATTPIRYILSQPALKTGYYTLLAGLFLYIIFMAKRKQRLIPVITPPRNILVDYVRTVAQLYYKYSDHKSMVFKKFHFLNITLQSKFYTDITDTSLEHVPLIAERTGAKENTVKEIFDLYNTAVNQQYISAQQLLKFNRAVERFYSEIF